MLIISEESLRREQLLADCAKKCSVPLYQFRSRVEEQLRRSKDLMSFEGAVELTYADLQEKRSRIIERRKRRAIIPAVWDASFYACNVLNDMFNPGRNFSRLDFGSAVSLYDPDWEGMSVQACFDKLVNYYNQKESRSEHVPSHFIVYHRRDEALRFVREHKPNKVVFWGYEPHVELQEILQHVGREGKVMIFGTHIRPDMKELAEKDRRINYFNSMDHGLGERPLTFLIWYVLNGNLYPTDETFGKTTAIPAILGNVGYGWSVLAQRIARDADVPYDYEKIRKITKKFIQLVALDHSNSTKVVNALTECNSYDSPSIKELLRLHKTLGIERKYDETVHYAIDHYRVIGDTVIFPIKGWETTKPFTFRLRTEAQQMQKDLAIIVDCNDPQQRKISLRTAYIDDERFDIAKLLAETFSSLPSNIERNYGAHKTSGGAVFPTGHQSLVFKELLKAHFKQSNQMEEIANLQESDLVFS